jgi:hypothetical protein
MDASGHGHLMLHDKRTRDISLGVTGGWEQDEDETEIEVSKTGFIAANTAAAAAGGGAATSYGSSVSSSTSDTTTAAGTGATGTGGSGSGGTTTMTDRARRLLSISSLPDGLSAATG